MWERNGLTAAMTNQEDQGRLDLQDLQYNDDGREKSFAPLVWASGDRVPRKKTDFCQGKTMMGTFREEVGDIEELLWVHCVLGVGQGCEK